MITRFIASLVSLTLLIAGATAQGSDRPPGQEKGRETARKAGDLVFTPYKFQFENQSIDAELGRLVVPENRSKANSNLIELAFVRLRSTAAKPGPPVIYLDGGPGSSAINLARAPEYGQAFLKLRESGDVILLDQRGVGSSKPNLTRLYSASLPTDFFETREKAAAVFKERIGQAAEHFRSQGVDIQAYNTRESAHDVDDLRKALGVERVSLVGFSYGTHLGLAVIRYHGANLNRVTLIGTEGQNFTHKLPSSSDRSLKRLSDLAAADPQIAAKLPDLYGTLKRILERLAKEPATVTITDRRGSKFVNVTVGKFGLQAILMIDLGDTNDLPIFPALIYTIDKGDYSILSRFVEKRYNQFGTGGSVMSFVMDAGSGATKDRWDRIRKEAVTALLGDTVNFPFPEISAVFGNPDLGDDYRSAIVTGVPTLFVSGELDNNCPSFQADEVRKTFKQSTHLIVANAGHESMLVIPTIQQSIVDFLNGADVSQRSLSIPPLRFVAIPESKPSAQDRK
jgi:pimeloyl-ACP methyl ester carboxylesterase